MEIEISTVPHGWGTKQKLSFYDRDGKYHSIPAPDKTLKLIAAEIKRHFEKQEAEAK